MITNTKKIKFSIAFFTLSVVLVGVYQNFTVAPPPPTVKAPECDQLKIDELLEPVSNRKSATVEINCSVQLRPGDVISKQVIFLGRESSNIIFDCDGATITPNKFVRNGEAILVQSRLVNESQNGLTSWSRPENIQIKNCNVNGPIRVIGMSRNGEGQEVRASSRFDANHTLRAQVAAPRNILFDNLEIKTNTLAIYIGPGATKITLSNSLFHPNKSISPVVYLDAESAWNSIRKNTFEMESSAREIIAVDGSANNLIAGNVFKKLNKGGIFIYRNCGEGGTVRHQRPTGNIIRNNVFYHQDTESISVGSRKGERSYCSFDDGFPFGSSVSDLDFADNTLIEGNLFHLNKANNPYFSRQVITSSSASTTIRGNTAIVNNNSELEFKKRVHGPFKDDGTNDIKNIK
jgi:hypothetical protein